MIDMKPESHELESLIAKYEKYQADNYDPSYVIGTDYFALEA